MATTTQPERQTTTRRGFKLPCFRCNEPDSVTVALDDVRQFSCASCSECWTADEVRSLMGTWQAALAWLDTAPEVK